MTDWYFLFAPIAVLAVLLLFRFVGCGFSPGSPDTYVEAVLADGPVAYFRLREKAGDDVAQNQIAGGPSGTFGTPPAPLQEGDPNWHSTGVDQPALDLGVVDPRLVQTDGGPHYSAIRFRGGYVEVPANVPSLANLTEFTLEVLLHPEWDVSFALGKYYCVLESADFVPVEGQSPPQQKNAGFGIYAGPDTTDPASPYIWQFWMGVGLDGFERLFPKPYFQPPGNPVANPGPIVLPEPTYLAVTFSQAQDQAFLYVYSPNRDLDYTKYELIPLPYVKASLALFLGIAPEGSLFGPISGPTILYPFRGLIGDVAIYNRVLDESTVRSHVINAFFNI